MRSNLRSSAPTAWSRAIRLINCKKNTLLILDQQDRRLELGARLLTHWHTQICTECRQFANQMQLLRKGIIAWSIHPGDDNNNDNNDIVPQPTKTSSSTLHESTTSMNKSSTPHKPDLSRWKPLLSEQAYSVMFEHGTERAGSSPLNQEKRDGTYLCAACYSPLFDSSYKYDSGTGWPSFWQSIGGALGFSNDHSLDYPRQEYHCAHCGAHQGHVFPDGPQPSGLRFCDNGVALHFVARDEEMPEVRQP